MRVLWALAVAVVLSWDASLGATVVPRKSFGALVTEADIVFRGQVESLVSQLIGNGPGIGTIVTFRVERVLKGDVAPLEALLFHGGTLGQTTYAVEGVPRFAVGERGIIFAKRGRYVSPLVGFWQGRFPIQRDRTSNADIVTSSTGRSFSSLAALDALDNAQVSPPMRVAEFEDAILRTLTQRP
jgi:hypothetical protein